MTTPIPRILLVEDNDDHAELITRALEEHGIEGIAERVKDGEAALDYLFGNDAADHRPDVILLDLRLPRIDGLEVLRRIKEARELKSIPVVVLTTSSADRDLASAYDSHVNAYVVKPVDYASLEKMLQDTSTFWLSWNRRRKQ
ncbi:response regulator [Paraliomyxa miuraensis]|uniref:response regulator n=1 Tax=Paraliomyxa miuraensis TaxID=376150 RepID=UPI00225C0CB4|nr:response regulator [Paraliomyxa miuraensis]MCX4247289.1 response regulator [Paraliomyxa miuraensis]